MNSSHKRNDKLNPNDKCDYYSIEDYKKAQGLIFTQFNCGCLDDWKFEDIKTSLISPHTGVLSLCETFFDSNVDQNSYNISNFTKYRQDRNLLACDKLSGGGLVTYINNKLISDGDCYAHLNVNDSYLECQFILIKKKECKDIIFINCYRAPDNKTIFARNKAINYLIENIKKIEKYQKKCIIISGDLNFDCFNNEDEDQLNDAIPANEFEEISNAIRPKEYIDNLCTDLGIENLITKPTCFRGQSSTALDLFLTNMTNICNFGILDFSHFDHRAVFLCKQRQHDNSETEKIFIRPYKKMNLDNLYNTLNNYDWESLKDSDIDIYWGNIKKSIITICDDLCPKIKIKVRNDLPCWYSNDLAYLRHDRDKLSKQARLDPTNNSKKEKAKAASKLFKKSLNNAKRDFTIDQLYECGGDQRKFWNELKKLLPGKLFSEFNSVYNENGDLLYENDALNYINKFFADMGKKIENKLSVLNQPTPFIYPSENICYDIDLQCFDECVVLREIEKIDISKSSGIDDISTFFIKTIFCHVPFVLADIFKYSFASGQIPSEWKEGKITIIPKKGSTLYPDNVRPICQTNIIIKTFEKLINVNLMNFLESNNILHPNQGGFRKNRSTIDTASNLINFLASSKNDKKYSIATFLDFSKAFDSVNHNLLLNKLNKIGIKGNLFRWLSSYLSNRTQVVRNSKFCSSRCQVSCGVPQGSVLGPSLFLCFINDIKYVPTSSTINLFADDTVLYLADDNLDSLIDRMQVDLDKISDWCSFSKLCLNSKKTNVICCSPSFKNHLNLENIRKLKIHGSYLNYVTECDYLGIRIDYKLFFDKFYEKVKNSVNHKLYMLGKVRKFLNTPAAVTVLKSMVLPFFEYGGIFLEASEPRYRDKLHRLFVRGIRISLNNFYTFYSEFDLHTEINFLPLCYRRKIMIAKQMFKEVRNNNVDISSTTYQTRLHDGPVIKVPDFSHVKYKRFLPWLGPSVWNSLPSTLRNLKCFDKFVVELKQQCRADFAFDEYFR